VTPEDLPFADLKTVDLYFFIQGLSCKPEMPTSLTIQPSFTSREEKTFAFAPSADMQWVTALRIGYLVFDQAARKNVHTVYIHHSDEEPDSSRTILFDPNTFTRPPKVFLALHGFSATTDPVKRFKISLGEVDKDSMEIVMEKEGYSWVHYLCVAVQYDE
jgi:hypothetical protein